MEVRLANSINDKVQNVPVKDRINLLNPSNHNHISKNTYDLPRIHNDFYYSLTLEKQNEDIVGTIFKN